ncbi:hypothetical protein L6452_32761 [Arctium lappa]|uniref:Uncharacterized protein n=1 Tax=Arctium lappa TaxID=4217 RepID=A0ACB8Z6E3_ARCLA|nr:hypothetical protein L6452_32761 [Arctium lappa]
MKGVVINEAGGRQKDKASDTSSQAKQKGIVSQGNLKLLSPSEGEIPSQFSPLLKGTSLQIIPAQIVEESIIPISVNDIDEEEEEEDESLSHPRRPSRPHKRSKDEVQRRAEMISNLESLRLKIPPQTFDEEFDFLYKVEIKESVRAEKLIIECQKDVDLALEVHSSLFNDDKMKKNPVKVQAALLKEIEEENAKIK